MDIAMYLVFIKVYSKQKAIYTLYIHIYIHLGISSHFNCYFDDKLTLMTNCHCCQVQYHLFTESKRAVSSVCWQGKTSLTNCFIRIYDCSIRVSWSFNLCGRAQQRFGGPRPSLGYATKKQTWRLKTLLSSEVYYLIVCLLCLHYAWSLPIMPALYSILWHAYSASNYAGIIGAGLLYGMLLW